MIALIFSPRLFTDSEESDDSDDEIALAGLQKKIRTDNRATVRDIFHVSDHREEILDLILDTVRDIKTTVEAIEKKQDTM